MATPTLILSFLGILRFQMTFQGRRARMKSVIAEYTAKLVRKYTLYMLEETNKLTRADNIDDSWISYSPARARQLVW